MHKVSYNEKVVLYMLGMKNWVIVTVTVGLLWWLRQWRILLQCRRHGFSPWVGKILWRREWLSTPVFLPGESHGQRTPWGLKESDRTEWLNTFTFLTAIVRGGETHRILAKLIWFAWKIFTPINIWHSNLLLNVTISEWTSWKSV